MIEKEKERKKLYNKRYQELNKNKIRKYQEEYRKNNRSTKPKKDKKYNARTRRNERMRNEPLFKLSCNIRSLISISFKKKKWSKLTKTQELLGCDFDFLYKHLLSSFIKNYNREPYLNENLDIDHIVPLSSAKTVEELLKLNHYTNLQWLRASDNRKKSNKVLTFNN